MSCDGDRKIRVSELLNPLQHMKAVACILSALADRENADDRVIHAYLGERLYWAGEKLDALVNDREPDKEGV